MTELRFERLEKMRDLAAALSNREMTELECAKLVKLNQQNFRTFITSMTERYLIYEYLDEKRHLIYGLLK
jgi:hypothetical protein